MKITRDVVMDLLPLHASGEASADTRALVEEYLKGDPALARLASALAAGEAPPSTAEPPREAAVGALERTKTLLGRRTRFLALALFLTGLPLSFSFDHGVLQFLLVRDAPAVASACWAGAIAFWIAYVWNARSLRVTGL